MGCYAAAYGIFHHAGTLFTPLGEVPLGVVLGQTRWADWLDLFTPYLLVLLGVAALSQVALSHVAAARRWWRWWAVFAVGAVTYVEGHGVHLSANSIGNRQPSELVHLWDETIGHYLQHSGLPLMTAALMAALGRQQRFPLVVALPLALLAGMTHVTNALEGGTVYLGMVVAAGFSVWGWRRRGQAGEVLWWAYLPALIALITYGMVRGGFTPPSAG